MADNVIIPTTGTGTATPVIATDDIGGVHFQKMKVNLGGDGVDSGSMASGAGAVDNTVPRVTLASDDPAVADLAAIEALLTTIDADTGGMLTSLQTLDNAISGNEMQVDIVSLPAITASNLDIRDLTQASDAVAIYGSDDGGTTKRIIKTDSGGAIQVDIEVATVSLSDTDNAVLDSIDTNTDSGAVVGAGAGATAQRVHLSDESLSALENITVISSGTVTANAGTNLNTSALALETGGNLASIKAKTDNIPALGQALATASVPVVLTAAQITTLTPPAAITGFATAANQLADGHNVTVDNAIGAAAVNIQDGGNTITVDGTVAVTNAGITTIAGAVAGTEMQVDVLTMPTVTVNAHAVTNAGTFAVQESGAALTALQLIDNAISGAGFNITQLAGAAVPIGAGLEATAVRVTLATDSTGVISVDDNGGVLTVDGTVTANLSATDNAVLDDIAANQTDASQKSQIVDGSGNVIGATSNALDVNIKSGGAGDGAILDGVSAAIKATVLDYTNSNPLAVRLTNTDGDYVAAGAGTQYTEADTDASITGTAVLMEVAGDALAPIQGTVAAGLLVNLGTNNDVTLATLPDTAAGDLALQTADLDTIAGDTTSIQTAVELLDNAVDGNYLNVNMNVAGTDVAGGSGVVSAQTIRVVLATDVALPTGANAIGKLAANTGVDIGDVDILSIIPGVGATNLGKAEDAAHASGDVGVMALTIRDDTCDIESGTEQDYEPLHVDATGALWTRDSANLVDDTAFGVATSRVAAIGMLADETSPDSVTEGDIGVPRMTLDRKQIGASDMLEDAAESAGTYLSMAGSVRRDAAASSAGASGDNATLNTDALGKLWTTGSYAEDAAHTSGDVGSFILAVRDDDPLAATSGSAGDYEALHTDAKGALWVQPVPTDIDLANAGTTHVKKYYTNAGAVTDGIIWSPAAGKRWYVTDIYIQISADATVTVEDDKAGGDDPIWKGELKAGGGWSHSFNTPWFSGEDAADLIITTSAGNVYVTVTGYEI